MSPSSRARTRAKMGIAPARWGPHCSGASKGTKSSQDWKMARPSSTDQVSRLERTWIYRILVTAMAPMSPYQDPTGECCHRRSREQRAPIARLSLALGTSRRPWGGRALGLDGEREVEEAGG